MRIRRWLAMLCTVVVVLGACGDDDAETSSGNEGSPSGEGEQVDDSDLDPDAIFSFAWVPPTSMDPHKSSISADKYVLYPVYDRLVHVSPDVEPIPGLATEWEFSEDGSSFEMTLREDVTFHDGEPFDAEAVKANIERGQTLEGSTVAGDLAVIDEVEIIDDTHVRFVLNGPARSLPLVLSAQPGMMVSPAAFDDPKLDLNPVGAGMMAVTEYEPGTRIVYEAHDGYWDPDAVKVAGMEAQLITDFNARLNALREGSLDAARLAPGQAEQATAAGLNVVKQDSIEIGMLSLNRAKEPLDDPDVRRALNMAIDREGIVNGVMFGLGTPAVQVYPEGYYAHDPDITVDTYAYDPEAAEQMLADAGYPDGFDMEINVAALDFVVSYAEAIQAQLAEIGVNATINQVELSQYGDVVYVQENGEGTAVIGAARTDPTQTALQFQPDAFTNPGGASSPEVQELYNRSLDSTLTTEERTEVLQELSATLVEQAFSIVIFHPTNPWGTSTDVVGLQPYRDVFEFRGVGIKKS